MSQHRATILSRWTRGVVAVLALVLSAGSLAAQGTTGKIEGTVTDPNGQPVIGAQVSLVGTSLGAVTGEKGYYFINNAPAGVYSLRATFIGLQPTEVRNVRVLAGQTLTVPFKLQGAVQLGAIAVTVETQPIVPRDQVTSKPIITGAVISELPTDDVRSVLALMPGVVESGNGLGLSIRGGRPGEAAVMVDGALVRSTQTGGSRLNLGTDALEEASITTGAFSAQFGDAQSGLVSFNTKAGGPSLKGSLSYATDEPFGNAISVGYNRWEGSLNGPLFGNLTFSLDGTLQGQQSSFQGMGAEAIPTYLMGGLDTNVTEATGSGDSTTVAIPRFVQFSGACDPAQNFGYACQGRRLPLNWSTNGTVHGKLQMTYGSGSHIFFSRLQSQDQNRNWPGGAAQAPQRFSGNWSA
ncbi:MAG TPA: carboxypeptidase regulatory-like domain-containing protein, partial [Gemmatimonadales bacterium]